MSLRARLLCAVGVVAVIALSVAGALTYLSTRAYLDHQVSQTLRADSAALSQAFYRHAGLSSQSLSYERVSALAPGAFVELRGPSGQDLGKVSATGPGGTPLDCALPRVIRGTGASGRPQLFTTSTSNGPRPPHSSVPFKVAVSSLRGGEQLIVAVPLVATETTLSHLLVVELAVAGAALFAAMAIGWWLVRSTLRPVTEMESTAGSIVAGDLRRRVGSFDPKTELGRLAAAFNSMLDRIQGAFAEREATEAALRASESRLRRFVADASHELRTPLAAVRAYAELSRREGIGKQDRDRAMAGISAEAARMTDLVEELLLLARLDQGRPLAVEGVELVSLAAQSVALAGAVGAEWPVSLDASEPVEVMGDPVRLRQTLDNLLANVRAHTPPGTRARVSVTRTAERAVLEVSDDGPGLGTEHAQRVFERFYRGEASRSRRLGGGSGLGLAIVAAIVNAHGGEVFAGNRPGGGAVFRFSLSAVVPLGEQAFMDAGRPAPPAARTPR